MKKLFKKRRNRTSNTNCTQVVSAHCQSAAGRTCLAALLSILSAMRPLSFHCTGGTICWRGGWSCLPARSSAAASCTLAPLSEGGRQGEESVKGEDEGCGCHTEREREREAESASLPATTHQASQPWRQRQINSWPLCDVRASTTSHGGRGRPALQSGLNQSHQLNGALH